MGHICAASCPCKFKLRSFPSCHELVPPLVGQKSPQGREAHRVLVSNLQEQHGESHHRLSLEFERESLQAPLIPRHDPTFETTASSMPSSRYDDTLSRVTSRISSLENCNGLCSCSCTGGEAPWVYIGPEISYWAQWAKLRMQLRCIVSRVTRKKSMMGRMGQEEARARSQRENEGFWARFTPRGFL